MPDAPALQLDQPEKPKEPVTFREFGDPAAIRQAIYDRTLQSASAVPSVSNAKHTLSLSDVGFEGPPDFSLHEQKRAILEGRTLSRRLKGTLTLTDNATGQPVARKRTTLAQVPYFSPRGTFILGGNEYTLSTQMRLRPGVYNRIKENGETESHFNITPGQGLSHRIELNPETGIFQLKFGTAHYPLVPVLRALGVTDSELRKHWGDLAGVNVAKADTSSLDRLHTKLVRGPGAPDADSRRLAVAEALKRMPLDPEVTRQTLGHPYTHVGPDVYLAATKKLLALSRREAEPDDRDHLAFMTVHGPEDLISERFLKDKGVLRRALWKATLKGNLDGVAPGLFSRSLQEAITGSGLGQPGESINPLQIYEQAGRISRMGVGGISSDSSVPESSRSVQPSQFGFVDFLATPESMRAGVDSRLASGAVKGSDGRLYAPFVDVKTGQRVMRSANDLVDKAVAFPGELAKGEPVVAALQGGRVRYVPRGQVHYELPDMEAALGPLANLVPMKSAIKGQRAAMGMRMTSQALPLIDPEAPLVQTGVPGSQDESFEQRYGVHAGALRSGHAGQVVAVEPDRITLQTADGKPVVHELLNNFPNNRKTYVHQTPVVRPGQVVQPGDLLARSNYTDAQGQVALGKNARVAYVPYSGPHAANYEDAWVVSRSFAERLRSEHMYQHAVQHEDGLEIGKKAHVSLFPGKYDRKMLANFDEAGVIRPGTTVHQGDPLVLAVKQRAPSRDQVYRGRERSYVDKTETWEHHAPGVVTDVAQTPDGVLVTVKSTAPLEVGDKVSARFGDKGLVGAIVDDAEMPQDQHGRPFEMLVNPLGLLTRCYDEQTEFLTATGWKFGRAVTRNDRLACFHPWTQNLYLFGQLEPMHVADYTGPMIGYKNKMLDFLVTPNHRMWTRCSYPNSSWHEETASRIYGKEWVVPVVGNPMPGIEQPFCLPHVEYSVKDTQSDKGEIVIDAGDWAEFLGWYVAEGNTDTKVHISQSYTANPEKCRRIAALLDRLPFAWNYSQTNMQFHVTSLRLCAYLAPLGKADEKYIPQWVFEQPADIRQRFVDAYWSGDGNFTETEDLSMMSRGGSISSRLVDDLQRLLVYQGLSSVKAPVKVASNARPFWRIGRHYRKERVLTVKGWHTVEYSGRIYCPTVPTGYVVTRRNGKLLIAGNTNPAQVVEAALGKIAERTGKPYRIQDFGNIPDLTAFAQQELARHGLTDQETIIDPRTGRRIPGVLTGNRFFMKLHHLAESKSSGRGTGGYSAEGTPTKGGEHGSKRMALMSSNALLSHGATNVLRDAIAVRGQANPEFWLQFMSGHTPPTSTVPFVHRKFLETLRAAGIHVLRDGPRLHAKALTDADIDQLAEGRALQNAETVDWKAGLKPIPGGLFDEALTGGHGGDRWSTIPLAEPMPNPVFEEPIRRVLGLTEKQFRGVLAGEEELHGQKGPAAIVHALNRINLPRLLDQTREEAKLGRKGVRDMANRRLAYLKAAEKAGLHPRDWVWTKAPVLPPIFRKVSVMQGNGRPMVADPNFLYQDLWHANENLKQMAGRTTDLGVERHALYDALKAAAGLGDPIQPKTQERGVKGAIQQIAGSSPKFGVVQRKLLSAAVDLVGRGVIVPDPDMDMDSVGLPERRAWDVYTPFVVRRLVRRGVPRGQAVKEVEHRTNVARKALLDEMDERPVILDRAPVLHRMGVLAFRPHLVHDETIHLSPFVTTGFGADFDGDQMNYQVPLSEGAVEDALTKMLPSRNLIAPSNFKVHQVPSKEFAGGLYAATAPVDPQRRPLVFPTRQDAVRAYRRGEIGPDQPVEILHS